MTRNTKIFSPATKWTTPREPRALETCTALCAPRTFLHQRRVEQHDLQGRWNFSKTMVSYQSSPQSLTETYQIGFRTREGRLRTNRTGRLANPWDTGNFISLSYLRRILVALVMERWGLTCSRYHTRLLTLVAPMCPVHS